MSDAPQVGIIGLGLAGKALAKRFLAADPGLLGYDIDPAAMEAAQGLGVTTADDPRQLASTCGIVVLSLLSPPVIHDVLWGARGIASACHAGTIILDTSTTDPAETEAHARRLGEMGLRFVDVCLVGPSDMLARGEALALVGALEADAAPFLSILRAISDTRFFLGKPGAGNSAKLAVNLVQGLNRLALAEGLTLGGKSGLDPAQLLAVFKASAAYSRVMDIKGQRMLDGDYQPAARLAQHAKDVDLIREVARRLGARTPLSEVHATVLGQAIAAGWGDLDNSAVMKVYQKLE